MKHKNDKMAVIPFVPSIESEEAKKVANTIINSETGYTYSQTDISAGKIVGERHNYASGMKALKMYSIPATTKKKDMKKIIKEMRDDGVSVKQISQNVDISSSYVYKLLREK